MGRDRRGVQNDVIAVAFKASAAREPHIGASPSVSPILNSLNDRSRGLGAARSTAANRRIRRGSGGGLSIFADIQNDGGATGSGRAAVSSSASRRMAYIYGCRSPCDG